MGTDTAPGECIWAGSVRMGKQVACGVCMCLSSGSCRHQVLLLVIFSRARFTVDISKLARMVYFVCEHCSETLKKNAAEKHFSCGAKKLTCVDCSKTFYGEEFRAHAACISEEEKYQKTLYKGGGKQKRDPQAEWTDAVCKAAENATKHKALLQILTGYSNVPRKLKPFMNFAKNSVKVYNDKILEELFALIQAAAPPKPVPANTPKSSEQSEDTDGAQAEESPAAQAPASAAAASKKRKRIEDESDAKVTPSSTSSDLPSSFNMKKTIVALLSSEAGGKSKVKRLKKRCAEAAAAAGVKEEGEAEQAFDKKYAKLVKKGRIVEDSAGKFCSVVGGTDGADGEDD